MNPEESTDFCWRQGSECRGEGRLNQTVIGVISPRRGVNTAMNKEHGRKVYIDFLKIIAIYLVLFNHTGINGFVLFIAERDSILYPFYLFNGIFVKIAVPLFFMTSGALLLGKQESIKTILTKRFLRFAVILLVGSVIAYAYECLRVSPQEMSLLAFARTLYGGQHTVAYWYLYAYLAFLLMLPFIRRLAQSMSFGEYIWMFLMYGFIQSLTILDCLVSGGSGTHNESFSFFITTRYVFFPLMGYFIDQKLEGKHFCKRNLAIMALASFVAILISCVMTHYWCSLIGQWDQDSCQAFFNTLIFLPTVTVFYGAKFLFLRYPFSSRTEGWITALGGTTFGLYLIEQICRHETRQIFTCLQPYLHTLPACWIWIGAACCLGMAVTWLLKKIPGMGKFI